MKIMVNIVKFIVMVVVAVVGSYALQWINEKIWEM